MTALYPKRYKMSMHHGYGRIYHQMKNGRVEVSHQFTSWIVLSFGFLNRCGLRVFCGCWCFYHSHFRRWISSTLRDL